jgi:hypothetical protein
MQALFTAGLESGHLSAIEAGRRVAACFASGLRTQTLCFQIRQCMHLHLFGDAAS